MNPPPDAALFVPVLATGFALSLGLTPLARQAAVRLGVVAKPAARNLHAVPTPLMGGLAIVAAFVLALLLFAPLPDLPLLGGLALACALMALVGLWDDRAELAPWPKMGLIALVCLGTIALGARVALFNMPWLDVPLALLWLLVVVNATNFQDNMDGLAAGMTSIAALFFLLIALHQRQSVPSVVAAALLGSALGFLMYNFSPSAMFMGDMGALTLGLALGALSILVEFGPHPPGVSWMIPPLVLGLPLMDTTLVVVTRLLERRSPLMGGKDHTSHRLLAMGFSQRVVALTLYAVCALCGVLGLVMSAAPTVLAWRLGTMGLALLALLGTGLMAARWRYQAHPAWQVGRWQLAPRTGPPPAPHYTPRAQHDAPEMPPVPQTPRENPKEPTA